MTKLLKSIQFILLSAIFMVLGVIIVKKFIIYSNFNFIPLIPRAVLNKPGLPQEMFFTLNLIIFSIILAVLMFFINKFLLRNTLKWNMLLSLVLFFPITNMLYFMAAFSDGEDYMPRAIWVFASIVTYVIISIILNLIKEKNIINRTKQLIIKGIPVPIILTLIINWFLIVIIYLSLKSLDLQYFIVYLKRTFSYASIGILLLTILSTFIIVKYSVKLRHVLIINNYIFVIYFLDLLYSISNYRLYDIIERII